MKISIFDFDKTLYDGDSSLDYMIDSIFHNPRRIINFIGFCVFGFLFSIGIIRKKTAKNIMFSLMNKDSEKINNFWYKKRCKLYQNVKDLLFIDIEECDKVFIISAGPDFLLNALVSQWDNVELLATETDETGRIIGENCYGIEKTKRLKKWFHEKNVNFLNIQIKRVVSDSKSDISLFNLGGQPYFIDKGVIKEGIPK